MIDLLVGSLMADGGLESALNAAITAEIQVRWLCAHYRLEKLVCLQSNFAVF